MQAVKIVEDVFWAGAINWTFDFYGLSIQRGTTYNAYVVKSGDKSAVIDTSHPNHYEEFMTRVKSIVNPEKIDYVICNHAEPDHSFAIPILMKEAVNAKVVATPKCIAMLRRLYPPADYDYIEVKEDDTLKLGEKTFRFIEAPFMHWPEVMFTYLEEDKILFPCDGFAAHIAPTNLFADKAKDIKDDAAKYFAFIFRPFAKKVRQAIEKVRKLDLKIIAPSHGPIIRENPTEVLDLWEKWSSEEWIGENKVVIAYNTMWGADKLMAETIADSIMEEDIEVNFFDLETAPVADVLKECFESKAIVLGSLTVFGGPFPHVYAVLPFLKLMRPQGKIGAAFGVHGWSGGSARKIDEAMKELKMDFIEPALAVVLRPDEEELQKCIELGKEIAKRVKAT